VGTCPRKRGSCVRVRERDTGETLESELVSAGASTTVVESRTSHRWVQLHAPSSLLGVPRHGDPHPEITVHARILAAAVPAANHAIPDKPSGKP
jgi:hypothetical protein